MPANPAAATMAAVGDLDAAARAVAAALAEWTAAIAAVRAEIRADAAAAGGDPDGPQTTVRVREAVAAARAALPEQDRAAYDCLINQLRAPDPRGN